jgi:hypothetical protein
VTPAASDHPPTYRLDEGALLLPVDQGCVGPSDMPWDSGPDCEQTICGQPNAFSLKGAWRERLDDHSVTDQTPGRLPDQDLARCRRLLEPGGNVDRIADHERAVHPRVTSHDFPGVDPRADLQGYAPVPLQLGVQLAEANAKFHRGTCRT